jgi:hypothetical protein
MNNLDKYLLRIIFDFLGDKGIYNLGRCSKKYYGIFAKVCNKRLEDCGYCGLYSPYPGLYSEYITHITMGRFYKLFNYISKPYSEHINIKVSRLAKLFNIIESRMYVFIKMGMFHILILRNICTMLKSFINEYPVFKIYNNVLEKLDEVDHTKFEH